MRVDTLEGITAVFVVTGGVSSLLERWLPERARAPYLGRERVTDWAYWPFSAFVSGNLTRAVTLAFAVAIAFATGYRGALGELPAWAHARSEAGLGALPFAFQLVLAIAAGDLVDYWNHRLRHTRVLFPFHAVHHAPRQLDWLSSVRMHPVDDLCDNVLVGVVVLGLGVRVEVWLATGPFLFFFNAWLHANLDVRLGPLRYVVATPAFHRWHHADEAEGPPCNFAGVLPIWDVLFGTFHLPRSAPREFGARSASVPEGLAAQLAFPFRVHLARVRRAMQEEASP